MRVLQGWDIEIITVFTSQCRLLSTGSLTGISLFFFFSFFKASRITMHIQDWTCRLRGVCKDACQPFFRECPGLRLKSVVSTSSSRRAISSLRKETGGDVLLGKPGLCLTSARLWGTSSRWLHNVVCKSSCHSLLQMVHGQKVLWMRKARWRDDVMS